MRSITESGSVPPLKELEPLIDTEDWSLPGLPDLLFAITPGTCPANTLERLGLEDDLIISEPCKATTELVREPFFSVPYPTTTTSSSCFSSGAIFTSTMLSAPTGIACETYPTNEKTKIASAPSACRKYLPSKSAEVPCEVPFTATFTPGNGSPVLVSVILPLMTTDISELAWLGFITTKSPISS